MDTFESLNHSVWECNTTYLHPEVSTEGAVKQLRQHLGEVFRVLAARRESRIEEGHLLPDHVHMLIAIRRSTPSRRWWAT